MPETKEIEVIVGKQGTGEGEAGKSTPTKPKEEEGAEVSGRHWVNRTMECWNCGGISWIEYDTRRYHHYTCCYCGADNYL